MSGLEARDLHVRVGAIEALRGFSLAAAPGELVGLSGRNGAGKTTFMKAVMGLRTPAQGTVRFDGEDLSARPTHARAGLGIGYMPEERGLVPELTVEENMLLPSWVTPGLDGPGRLEAIYEAMPEVAEMRGRRALLLSGGQQKLVALGRAMAAGTRLLLLDEPFEGVAPALAQRLGEVIARLKGGAVTVVLSQSEMHHAFDMFDHEVVIERGANRVGAPA